MAPVQIESTFFPTLSVHDVNYRNKTGGRWWLVTLVDYFDVWGNAKDGYEVNDCTVAWTRIASDAELANPLEFIKCHDFLNEKATARTVVVDDSSDSCIEFYKKRGHKPICRLDLQPITHVVTEWFAQPEPTDKE